MKVTACCGVNLAFVERWNNSIYEPLREVPICSNCGDEWPEPKKVKE